MIRPIETKLNISLLENDFSADWKKRFNIEENTILSLCKENKRCFG